MRININDQIDPFWGISARSISAQIKEAARTGEALDVVISSPGGAVFEGLQIYHEIKSYVGVKNVTVVGIAASIASIIAMAGDKIRMAKGSMMMVHNPWTYTAGTAEELRKDAETLDKLADSLNSIYQAKTGKSSKEIAKIMDNETYMTASESVSMGFATEEVDTIQTSSASAYAMASLDPEKFKESFSKLKSEQKQPKENLSDGEKIAILSLLQPKSSQGATMKTIEQIKAEAPELYAQIVEEAKASVDVEAIKNSVKAESAQAVELAVKAERDRVKAIKAMSVPGFEAVINEAIESGKTPEQASMAIVAKISASGSEILKNIKANETEAGKVPTAPKAPAEGKTEEELALAKVNADLKALETAGYIQ